MAARARQLRGRMAEKERALASLALAKQEARYTPEQEATHGAEHEAPAVADAAPWHGDGSLQGRAALFTEAPATPSVEDCVEDLTATPRPPPTASAVQDRLWLRPKDEMQSGCARDACEIEMQGEVQRGTPAGTAGLLRRQKGAAVAAQAASARAAERVAAAKAAARSAAARVAVEPELERRAQRLECRAQTSVIPQLARARAHRRRLSEGGSGEMTSDFDGGGRLRGVRFEIEGGGSEGGSPEWARAGSDRYSSEEGTGTSVRPGLGSGLGLGLGLGVGVGVGLGLGLGVGVGVCVGVG